MYSFAMNLGLGPLRNLPWQQNLRTAIALAIFWAFLSFIHNVYISSLQNSKFPAYEPAWPEYYRQPKRTRDMDEKEHREYVWRLAYWKHKRIIKTQYIFNDTKDGLKRGVPFKVNVSSLLQHRLPFRRYVQNVTNPRQYVFVTASSVGHVYETMDAIASIQRFFPQSKVLYYDWGLKPWQIWDIKRWCNVEVRQFNFSHYPVPDMLNRKNASRYQSAKIFTILDALHDYPMVVWIDASVRFTKGDLSAAIYKAKKNGGLVFISNYANHSTFAVTHPWTYRYLPSDMNAQKVSAHFESNAILIFRTRVVYENILWYWYLCAMEPKCIIPTTNVECHIKEHLDRGDTQRVWLAYLNCNRVDQAVVNILALNKYNFKTYKYYTHGNLVIRRKMTRYYALKMCYGPKGTTLIAP